MIVAALLALTGVCTQAAEIRSDHRELAAKIADPELRNMTEQVLQRKNHYYAQEAIANQTEKGENFTYMRVEVTGVMSNDDTGEYDTHLFDAQIKPSFSAVENMSFWRRAKYNFDRKIDPLRTAALIGDSVEYSKAASGVTTENARKKLEPYRNAEINELVAHSWGCELVYAAILNGDILPPKKLIVVGVPDNDRKKWEMLAAYTGTEVHWARSDNDMVKHAQDDAELIGLKAGAAVDFRAKWEAACAARSCRAHNRKSKRVIVERIGELPGVGGHARTEYYDVLERNKVLKGSHEQLRASMFLNMDTETRRVENKALEEALVEARELVAQAREQVEIAHRDHDARLRNTKADMARRSCASPGSVTQAELDGLPDPYNRDFVDAVPDDLRDCGLWVYMSLGRGADAEGIRKKSTPTPGPADPHPSRPAHLAPSSPKTSFFTVLPGLKEYAVTACATPDQVPLDTRFTRPNWDFSFSKETDDQAVEELSAGLGVCERRLFHRLIGVIRNGNPQNITPNWLQDRVREYTPHADTTNGHTIVSPPFQQPPGGDPCRDRGNIRCP